jgi:hypothetical protein
VDIIEIVAGIPVGFVLPKWRGQWTLCARVAAALNLLRFRRMALFCSFAFAGIAQSLGAASRLPKPSIEFVDLSSHGFVLP